ncbi:LpxL/LpxP family Kdo(2)-lipid IV(A) lauroyl/palmitoleoyl acyltransferase [Aliikangiella sp. IMCC44653]
MQKPINRLHPKHWPSVFAFSLVALVGKLPLKAQTRLAKLVAWLMLNLAQRRRKIAETNIALCFPQLNKEEQYQLLKDNFYCTALGLIETASCWFTPLESRINNSQLIGAEHLDNALAKGKGVLLLSFHLTSLEIGGCLLAKHYPLMAMYKPSKGQISEEVMRNGRLKHVAGLLKQTDIRSTVKSLKKNQIVWYATDQNYGNKSAVFVPFFNTLASTITATTKFCKMTGATVVPFTQKRSADGQHFTLEIHPAFENFPGQNETEDAARINLFLEKYLVENPADYMWLHQRFRTRPPGEEKIYPKK